MKDFLLQFGLTEEQATQLITEIDKMPAIPKKRFDEVNNKKNALQEEINNYEYSIDVLKKNANGDEELKKQLEDLKNQQSTLKAEYESKLSEERLMAALKLDLNGQFHDLDYTLGKIDKSLVKLDENGKIVDGLQSQLDTIKEKFSFNVVQKQAEPTQQQHQTPPTTIQGWNPVVSDKQQTEAPTSIGAMIASQFNGK